MTIAFKCPVCASVYFGPIFEDKKHVGRFCKGWPSGCDRSYTPCRGLHEERFERPNVMSIVSVADKSEAVSNATAKLVPCPLCGADKGYHPPDAKKFLWLSICCASCGSEIAQQFMASAPPAEWPDHLDAAWNAAGKHAQGLRDEIAALKRAAQEQALQAVADFGQAQLNIKRYDHFCSYDGGGPAEAVEAADGEFVRYEDVAAEIAKLQTGHDLYEVVRRMSVPQFLDAYLLNRNAGQPFDEIVAGMAHEFGPT